MWANCNLRILNILTRRNFENKSGNRRFRVFFFGLHTFFKFSIDDHLLRCLLRAWNQFGYKKRGGLFVWLARYSRNFHIAGK